MTKYWNAISCNYLTKNRNHSFTRILWIVHAVLSLRKLPQLQDGIFNDLATGCDLQRCYRRSHLGTHTGTWPGSAAHLDNYKHSGSPVLGILTPLLWKIWQSLMSVKIEEWRGLSRNQTNNWFPDGLSCDHQRSKWFYNVIIWQQFGAQAYAATRLPPTCCIHSLANHQSFVSNHCVKNSSYARIGGAKSIHSARNYRRIQTFCLWILDIGEWYEPTYSISLSSKSPILKIIWRQQINVNQSSDRDYTIAYCLVSLCSEWGSIK